MLMSVYPHPPSEGHVQPGRGSLHRLLQPALQDVNHHIFEITILIEVREYHHSGDHGQQKDEHPQKRPDSSLCQRGQAPPPSMRCVAPTSSTVVSAGQTDLPLEIIIDYIFQF